MSDIEKSFMSRFDSLVALHQSENNPMSKEADNNIVPLTLNAVEEEQQRILNKAYGHNHVNYNQSIQSMREQNAKMAASLGYVSPRKNESTQQSTSFSYQGNTIENNNNNNSNNYNNNNNNNYTNKATPTRQPPPAPNPSMTLADPRDHQITVLRQTLVKERKASARALERAYEREVFLKKQIDILRSSNDTSLLGVGDVEMALDRMRESNRLAMASAQERAAKAEEEVALMKKSLIKAKAYHLHTTMEKLILDSTKSEKKFKAMIGNLQAEKNLYLKKIATMEQNIEQLGKEKIYWMNLATADK